MTKIEWASKVWNPLTGCTKVSDGCRNCYAHELHSRRHKGFLNGAKLPQQYAKPFSEIQLFPERLIQPKRWKKPERIFVNSMSDLFHDDVPEEFIREVFRVMVECPQHTFMILTKRAKRMHDVVHKIYADGFASGQGIYTQLQNVWLGVSTENQAAADERIPYLLDTPASVRFLSCEPLVDEVDLMKIQRTAMGRIDVLRGQRHVLRSIQPVNKVDCVIVGGESGTGARPMHPKWARSLRNQCLTANVPFFMKQFGEWHPDKPERYSEAYKFGDGTWVYRVGKKKAGRLLDGREWNEIPCLSETEKE